MKKRSRTERQKRPALGIGKGEVRNKRHKRLRPLCILLALVLLFAGYCIWQNNAMTVSQYQISSETLPQEFEGFTIVQVSDLHNKRYGEGQQRLLEAIAAQSPDLLVITGDLIDRHRPEMDAALEFVRGAVDLCPVYFVSGNHENWWGNYPALKQQLLACGVHVLEDETALLERNGESIALVGMQDPTFGSEDYTSSKDTTAFSQTLRRLCEGEERFSILLSHRPELFDLYVQNGVDLAFTGHAHGGQIRLPWIGAIYVPDQGFFPKYVDGVHEQDGTQMVVSRGLGSSYPIRTFNRPELVCVTLHRE